jgi:carboxymethylenebutenolidase
MSYEVVKFPDTAGNQIPGWLFRPKNGNGMGVCKIHDIFGLRADYENVVAPFVDHGYNVLVPDMFYDVEPVDIIDPDGNKRKSYRGQSSTERHLVILEAAVKKLKDMPETGGKVGVTGYCLGGTLCFLATARMDDVDAAAGYYATSAHDYLDEAKNIRRPLMMHIPETDRTHTPADAQRVRDALDGVAIAKWFIYPGAVHGFANNDHSRFDPAATQLANNRTFELFDSVK